MERRWGMRSEEGGEEGVATKEGDHVGRRRCIS
jgi:hypothetical protein